MRLDLTHDDGQVGERLENLPDPAAAARAKALDHQRLADMGLGDDQIVDVEVVIVLGVGDRRFQTLAHVAAMRLRENSRSASAVATFLPRISCATRLSFCGADPQHLG